MAALVRMPGACWTAREGPKNADQPRLFKLLLCTTTYLPEWRGVWCGQLDWLRAA